MDIKFMCHTNYYKYLDLFAVVLRAGRDNRLPGCYGLLLITTMTKNTRQTIAGFLCNLLVTNFMLTFKLWHLLIKDVL